MPSQRFLFFFFIIQVASAAPTLLLPFLPTPEGNAMNNIVSRSLNLPRTGGRYPRHLVPILSLLWPQVVGPMHDGVIQELNYKEIPKSPLETYLDTLRERSRHEVNTRQLIREIINNGPVPQAQILAHPPADISRPTPNILGGLMQLPANPVHFNIPQHL